MYSCRSHTCNPCSSQSCQVLSGKHNRPQRENNHQSSSLCTWLRGTRVYVLWASKIGLSNVGRIIHAVAYIKQSLHHSSGCRPPSERHLPGETQPLVKVCCSPIQCPTSCTPAYATKSFQFKKIIMIFLLQLLLLSQDRSSPVSPSL